MIGDTVLAYSSSHDYTMIGRILHDIPVLMLKLDFPCSSVGFFGDFSKKKCIEVVKRQGQCGWRHREAVGHSLTTKYKCILFLLIKVSSII